MRRARSRSQIYPGTVQGGFLVTLLRKKNRSDFTTGSMAINGSPGADLGSGLRARAAVTSGGVSAVGLFPSIESIVEWWAQSRRNGGAADKANLDIMAVRAGSSLGLAIFPRNLGPTVDPITGAVGASDKTYVLSPSDFRAFAGMGPLPLIGDWAAGQPVTIDRSDSRTYAGGPIPVRYGGVGSCLDGATGSTSLYTVHSPVNLQLTDSAGKALGVNAAGKAVAAGKDGIVYKVGDAVSIIAPADAYKASIVATGKGPVTIESDTPRGTTSVRFEAWIEVKAANGEIITLANDRTGHLHGYWPSLKKGLRTFTVLAAGYAPTQVKVRVR